jgi:peptidoglycan/xylan/chitin deacetylase (PgdA/CDA1 family)
MLGAWSRNAAFRAVWHSGALALTRPFCVDRLLILRYHSICADDHEPEYVSRSISLPAVMFEQQMRHISSGYHCIPLDEAVDCLNRGRPLPRRSIVVTFDDGYQDNYRYAFPILAKYRVPATIYLVSSTLAEDRVLWTSRLRQALTTSRISSLVLPELNGSPFLLHDETSRAASARRLTNTLNTMPAEIRQRLIDRIGEETQAAPSPLAREWFLTCDQIHEMSRHGISFGAHTVTHPNLPGLDPVEASTEIERTRRELERLIGTKMLQYSYPNRGALHPHFNETVVDLVRGAGYQSAVTSQEGPCPPGSDVFHLHRVGINRARSSPHRFGALLEATRLSRMAQATPALE